MTTIPASRRNSASIRPRILPRLTSPSGARPTRRDPARAGRQRPDRDGRGVHARRFRCVRCAHVRPAERPLSCWTNSRASPPAADSPTATCLARAAAGRPRFCSTKAARAVRCVLRRSDKVRARRLQRLSDDGAAEADHPGCGTLAEVPAQRVRTIRGAPGHAGSARIAIDPVFKGMAGSRIPVAVAHGEGRAAFTACRRHQDSIGLRCVSSTIAASRPKRSRSIRTVRPKA